MASKSKQVHVLIGPEGKPTRIFRTKEWLEFPSELTPLMDRGRAVGLIREQVFERSGVDGENHECEQCGKSINWTTFEMNEIRPKGAGGGKTGGEVSLENCEALCHSCHQGSPDSVHGNRRWQTAKIG